MDDIDDLAIEFASRGLRATKQRIATLRILRQLDTHPNVKDLHRRLTREQPNVSQKTVYEVLDTLAGAGLARAFTDHTGIARFEANTKPHYHALCRSCGLLIDMEPTADPTIRGRADLPEGFDVDGIEVTVTGVCYRCRDQV